MNEPDLSLTPAEIQDCWDEAAAELLGHHPQMERRFAEKKFAKSQAKKTAAQEAGLLPPDDIGD